MNKRVIVIAAVVLSAFLFIALAMSGASAASQNADPVDTTRIAQVSEVHTKLPGVNSNSQSLLSSAERGNCDQHSDHGNKIKCLNQELLTESCDTLRYLNSEEFAEFFPLTSTQYITACTYAAAMVSTTEAATFASVGMSRTAEAVAEYAGPDRSCNDKPFPECLGPGYAPDGNLDGICQLKKGTDSELEITEILTKPTHHGQRPSNLYREWCAEVTGDNVGDDDGFCEYQGKGMAQYLEPCVKAANVSAIDQQPGNFNESRLIAIENALEDSSANMRAMRVELATMLEEYQAVQATGAESSPNGGPEECLDMLRVDPSYLAPRPSYDFLSDWLAGSIISNMLLNTCTSVFGTDVWGFNGMPACVAPSIALAVSDALHAGQELIDDAITGARVDNAAACLQYLGTQMNGVQDSLDFLVEWRRLHLAVIELQEKSDYLIAVSEAGRPSYIVSHTVRVSERDPVLFVTVDDYATWTEIDSAAGLWQVHLDLPPDLSNVQLFLFELSHTETYTDTSVVHSGFTVFDRDSLSSICPGQ